VSRPPPPVSPLPASASWLLFPALVGLLLVFPPETRGESMAGAGALVVLAGLVLARRRWWSFGAGALALGFVAFVPLAIAAQVRGQVPEAWGTLLLALSAGTLARAAPAERNRGLVLTVGAIGALVAAWGVFQSVYGLGELASQVESGMRLADETKILARAQGGRAFAGFATPASLGGCLVLCLPLTIAAALERTGIPRKILFAATVVQACGLLAARSASAVGALVLALGLFALRDRRSRRIALVALVLATALLAIVAIARSTEVTDASAPESAWRMRAGNARIALEMIADHPWLGVGPGGYGEAYPQYRRAGDNESQHAHVVPLELCAEWGLVLGTMMSIGLLVALLGPLLRAEPGNAGWKRGAAVGLAALAIQSLADFTLLLPSLLWTAAIVRGRLAATEDSSSAPGGRGLLQLGALAATIVAATVLALGGLAWNGRFSARQAIAESDFAGAATHAERATRLAPWDPDGWLLLGHAALSKEPQDADLAAASAERAVALAPIRPAARALRARVRIKDGDVPGALADAAEAVRLYPLSPPYARTRDELERSFRAPGSAP
jgi:O-antigen ligase